MEGLVLNPVEAPEENQDVKKIGQGSSTSHTLYRENIGTRK